MALTQRIFDLCEKHMGGLCSTFVKESFGTNYTKNKTKNSPGEGFY